MSNLNENLNEFNYHFDKTYKMAEVLREQFTALSKTKTAAEKRAAAMESLLSVFPVETQKELIKYVETIEKGLPLYSSFDVIQTFADGLRKTKEFTGFCDYLKNRNENSN